jgi:transmembrane sensor
MVTTKPGADDGPTRTAAEWWTRLREPEPTSQTIEQWQAWLEADPRHAQAFEQVCRLGESLHTADASTRASLQQAFAPAERPRSRWLAGLAIAASLVVAVLGWRVAVHGGFSDAVDPQRYASDVGQNRDIRLSDGSTIELGAASSLTARYAKGQRAIELSAGEAFFTVTHERDRPFVVAAGPVQIEDLGTAFNVRRTGQQVTVAVTQGRVRVQAPAPGDKKQAGMELVAGQQASYDPRRGVFSMSSVAVDHVAVWRDNRLEFVNEPLSTVIANVNRYSRRPVQIADPRLGELTFTGTVKINTIDSWIGALPRVFPVQVSSFADHVVLTSSVR